MPISLTEMLGQQRSRSLKKLGLYLVLTGVGVVLLAVAIVVQQFRYWFCWECPQYGNKEISLWYLIVPISVFLVGRFWYKYNRNRARYRAIVQGMGYEPEVLDVPTHDVPFHIVANQDPPLEGEALKRAQESQQEEMRRTGQNFRELEEWRQQQLAMRMRQMELERENEQLKAQLRGNNRIGFK